MNHSEQTRRTFIKETSLATAGLVIGTNVIAQQKSISPNDKIQVGVIGCNGMGWSNTRSMLKNDVVECVALCDVDQHVLDVRSKNVQEFC